MRLFIRLKDGLALTDEGNAYFPGIRSAVMELRHSTEHLQEANNNSVLTTSTLPSLGGVQMVVAASAVVSRGVSRDRCARAWRTLRRTSATTRVRSWRLTSSRRASRANEEGLPMWQAFVWHPASAAGFLSSPLSNFHLRMFLRSIFPAFDARGVLSPYSFAESKNSQAAK